MTDKQRQHFVSLIMEMREASEDYGAASSDAQRPGNARPETVRAYRAIAENAYAAVMAAIFEMDQPHEA